ncbi:MAG TPA: hypothetical protein VMN38_09720 [Sphingomicrobium sp.]|nr:hypothetical protein [Sphingomicrobium sp.]
MRSVSLVILTLALGACSTTPQPMGRSAEADAHLQELIAGKVPGQGRACLPHYRANNMVVIDDNTVVFDSGRTVYRNDFQGGACSRLGSGFYAMLTKTSGGTGLCRGDIAQVVDTTTGITVGSCVLGDFVPYTTPRG